MSVSQTLTVTQESQSISNNTSTIRIKWTSTQSGASYNSYENTAYYWVSVNGGTETRHSVKYTLPKSTTKTIVNTTLVVDHNSSGNCTVSVRTWMDTEISAGEITKSKTLTCDTIPRKSTLVVDNGTLGTQQTLFVTKKKESFTHSIRVTCGDYQMYIKSDGSTQSSESKYSSSSVLFTPPLTWAAQYPTKTSVEATLRVTTYNGSTSVGYNTYTKTFSVPSSVAPTCSIGVSDAMGYYSTFNGYIKLKSKFAVSIESTTSYGANIDSVKTTANGTDYTSPTFTTDVLKSSGSLSISTRVTDKRGRSGTATRSINVLDYAEPTITGKVNRCNSDGTENPEGAYIKVTFSGTVTALSNRNTSTWKVKYKKSSDTNYNSVTQTSLANQYTVNNATYIFAADTGSSYDVIVSVTDYFNKEVTYDISASTASTIMHFKSNGKGIAFGKVSETDGTAEFGFTMKGTHAELINSPTNIPSNADLDNYKTPGYYLIPNATVARTVNHRPVDTELPALIENFKAGDSNQTIQRYTLTATSSKVIYQRVYASSWGDWYDLSPGFVIKEFAVITTSTSIAGNDNLAASTYSLATGDIPVGNYQLLGIVGHNISSHKIRPTSNFVNPSNNSIYIGYHNCDDAAASFTAKVRLLWGKI